MNGRQELDRAGAMSLLVELGRRLGARGVTGDIRLVGGVAVMLTGSDRRTTYDVDASYAPKADVELVAREMAEELGLPADWLNDRAHAFIPDGADWVDVDLGADGAPGGLTVRRASEKTLLAMKMAAERDGDIPDLAHLSRRLHLQAPEELVDIAFAYYGTESIPLSGDRDDYLIVAEEALDRADRENLPRHP